MDPRMMRQWLAAQSKKKQITEADIQRKRLGIAEDNNQKPYIEKDNTPSLLKRPRPEFKTDKFDPATDSYISNEPTWKISQGEYIKGQGPLSPEELNKKWIVPDKPPGAGWVPPKDDEMEVDDEMGVYENFGLGVIPTAAARTATGMHATAASTPNFKKKTNIKEQAAFNTTRKAEVWITDGVIKNPITGKMTNKNKRLATPEEIHALGFDDPNRPGGPGSILNRTLTGIQSAIDRGGPGFSPTGGLKLPSLPWPEPLRFPQMPNTMSFRQ